MKGKNKKTKIFVSGCFDILHGGHIQFFEQAKQYGDYLTVSFANEKVLKLIKNRVPSIPDEHKKKIIESLKIVDNVVSSSNIDKVLDFKDYILNNPHDILIVTEDDKNIEIKKEFCNKINMKFIVLSKNTILKKISTTDIRANIVEKKESPLRIDFAGGWLDVPKFSKKGSCIVNCTISPLVSLKKWNYKKGSGLGGSAAYNLLLTNNAVSSELKMGVGWQDPAIIMETGLCVWRSGKKPILEEKYNPYWLEGKMLIYWTGNDHYAPDMLKIKRDFELISKAGEIAKNAVENKNIKKLGEAINLSYKVQIGENMKALPDLKKSIAKKYLGAGHGGYALYLFENKKDRDNILKIDKNTKKIEPYIKEYKIL